MREESPVIMNSQTGFMNIALEQARLAGIRGEVPVGAVLVCDGEIVTKAGNETRELNDPTAHAEVLVIRKACKIRNSERLPDCDLYVTLEPCPMCAAVVSFARIRRLYYGASDMKSGAVEHGPGYYGHVICHHVPEIYSGFQQTECSKLLSEFFVGLRRKT